MKRIKPIPGSPPLFGPESDWVAPNLSDLPDWSRAKLSGLDTEFEDSSLRELGIGARRGAKIVGYSFCLDGDRPYYIPLRHPGPGNVDCDQGLNYLRDSIHSYRGILVGANMNVDLDVLFYEGIKPNYNNIICKDIQVRDPLIWEHHFKYSFEHVSDRWGFPGKDETKLKEAAQAYGYDINSAGWKACIAKLPAKFVGPYGEHDAGGLIPIYHAQQKVIDEQGLNEVDNLESGLLPLLLKMRQRGVRIDFDHLDRVEAWALEQETICNAEIKRITGVDIGVGNCMTVSRVAPALRAKGIEPPMTPSGNGYSIKSPWLATINDPDGVAKLIHQLRQMNKLRTTFCASIRRYQTNGRIHTTFRQIVGASEKNEQSGAAYGRLSSAHPNLQQQPSRAKFANFWRSIYLPEQDAHWVSCDYSGIEPRWYCHVSEVLKLPGAKEFGDMYRANPRMSRHQAVADLTKLDIKSAKTVGLGLDYRMGSLKLANSLELPTRWLVQTGEGRERRKHYFNTRKEALDFRHASTDSRIRMTEVAGEEAQAILDTFHSGMPFIRELAVRAEEKAKATGILKILGGRHLHFPMDKHGEYQHTYKACSKVVQGTAAYQMKLALLALDRDCPEFELALQIHDEVCGSVWDPMIAKKVSEIMINVVKSKIPFVCDVDLGPNWGEARTLCLENTCLNYAEGTKENKHACKEHAKKVA